MSESKGQEGIPQVKTEENASQVKMEENPSKMKVEEKPADSLVKASTSTGKSQNRVQVPKFLVKTYNIVEEGNYEDYVSWNEAGDALVVKQVHGFTEVVLPTYFKHSNFASFVRQLNMYGFRRTDDKEITFRQENFQRGRKDKLALIRRKVTSKQAASINHENEIKSLLLEVKRLKASQEKYGKQMMSLQQVNSNLERENNMMWDALNRAKERQDLLASKMQKIMLFLYKAYRAPPKKIRYPEPVPQIADRSPDVAARNVYSEGQALERANSLIQGLESSDRLLQSIDPTHGTQGVPSPIGSMVPPESSSSPWSRGGPQIQQLGESEQPQSPPIVQEPSEPGNSVAGLTADSLVPLDTNTLEPLLRSQHLQDLGSVLKNKPEEKKKKYLAVAKDMDKHLLDQDNTLQRLNTVESMIDDPLDNFLDYTTPDQINSILDIADDGDLGSALAAEDSPAKEAPKEQKSKRKANASTKAETTKKAKRRKK